jgi:aminoglycoside phosphotransferase (APT) family kinase protein
MDWVGLVFQAIRALPSPLRFWLYDILASIGTYTHPEYKNRRAQRLPLNLFLKRADDLSAQNEVRAIELVSRHTSIVTPRILDNLYDSKSKLRWLIMTRLDGSISAKRAIVALSPEQKKAWTEQLRKWLEELRRIPNPFSTALCSCIGGPLNDQRIMSRGSGGPFRSETELNKTLRHQFIGGMVEHIDRVHAIQHDISFTHADLSHRNVLMKDGKIVGIVDWETAGWYPEYWEYAKAHFLTFRMFAEWSAIWKVIFPQYEEELELEMEFWSRSPAW